MNSHLATGRIYWERHYSQSSTCQGPLTSTLPLHTAPPCGCSLGVYIQTAAVQLEEHVALTSYARHQKTHEPRQGLSQEKKGRNAGGNSTQALQ